MTIKPRPLSPHLGIYKPQISSVLSILHRATGVAISFGLIVFVIWLVMLAGGQDTYNFFVDNLQNLLGILVAYAVVFFIIGFSLCALISLIVKSPSKILKWIKNIAIVVIAASATVGAFTLGDQYIGEPLGKSVQILGEVVLFGITCSFFYHLCNGIRHLCWDAGKFLSIRAMNVTGWIVVALSAIMSLGLWAKILGIATW